MAKASLASLAAGVASRLGQLTVQTAKQARTRAEQLARKGLTDATKLLDQALDNPDAVEAKEAKTVTRKTKTAKLPAPKAKRSTKR
jgi:hypothetical protein